jgi:hypothetical protein
MSQQFTDVTQLAYRTGSHAFGDSLGGPEQVRQDWNFVTGRPFEQKGGPALAQYEVTDRCHLQPRRDWIPNPGEIANSFQRSHESAQIPIFHIRL